jgi:hypothetical protein
LGTQADLPAWLDLHLRRRLAVLYVARGGAVRAAVDKILETDPVKVTVDAVAQIHP